MITELYLIIRHIVIGEEAGCFKPNTFKDMFTRTFTLNCFIASKVHLIVHRKSAYVIVSSLNYVSFRKEDQTSTYIITFM